MGNLGVLVLLPLFLVSPSALAGTWQDSFTPESVATYLGGKDGRVAVALAGDGHSSEAVRDAFMEALKSAGVGGVVCGSETFGAPSNEDAAIVTACKTLDAIEVVVIRVFAQEKPIAVVTIYDGKGDYRDGFSVVQGEAAVPASGAGESGTGNARAGQVVSRLTDKMKSESVKSPQELYDDKVVSGIYRDRWGMILRPGAFQFFEGKEGRHLDRKTFLRLVGRGDKVDRNKLIRRMKMALLGAGGVAISIGALMNSRESEQPDYEQASGTVVGLTLGGGMLMAGSFFWINPSYMSEDEARDAIRDYNRKLKSDLGLSLQEKAQHEVVASRTFLLVPTFSKSSIGLTLAVSL